MRKHKVTHLQVPTAVPAKGERRRGTLPWAHDMTGHAMDMAHQLETVARRLSGISGGEAETELANIMGLFHANLEQISELLDEVRTVMEDVNPLLRPENDPRNVGTTPKALAAS
jgi:hypothetical protein